MNMHVSGRATDYEAEFGWPRRREWRRELGSRVLPSVFCGSGAGIGPQRACFFEVGVATGDLLLT